MCSFRGDDVFVVGPGVKLGRHLMGLFQRVGVLGHETRMKDEYHGVGDGPQVNVKGADILNPGWSSSSTVAMLAPNMSLGISSWT